MAATVLILDDSPTIRFITKVYLTGLGVEIKEASDGREGLAMIEAGGIDLVVSDLTMPGIDGLEFVRRLRASQDPRHNRIPVIILTMECAPGLRERLIAAGANEYLTKPVSNTALRARVLSLLPPAPDPG
ncbi:MAG: Chemotaxis regulator, partial [Myxococcaceae bacterium]|nr:Chemotaxis regulator [Myxococcaceae bacterium]